jgi:hypothetical protein
MVGLTEKDEVVWIVVPGILVEMGKIQAGTNLKPANDATTEWVLLVGNAASLPLISRQNRRYRLLWHVGYPVNGGSPRSSLTFITPVCAVLIAAWPQPYGVVSCRPAGG